jgi:hypothetical protein
MKTTKKLYFLNSSQNHCHTLDSFDLEELEDEGFEIYEAIPDNNNKEFIFCTYYGEVVERELCSKKWCPYYESKSGRGVCSNRGKLYEFGEKINVKELIQDNP